VGPQRRPPAPQQLIRFDPRQKAFAGSIIGNPVTQIHAIADFRHSPRLSGRDYGGEIVCQEAAMKARSVAAFLGLIVAGGAVAATPPKPTGPFANLKFRNLGPAVSGGRVSTVTGIPGQPNIYYVGTAGGGVWKTTDDGIKWDNVFKHGDAASIGAVALAPSDPKKIWLGTGEANPRNDVLLGRGVYFSPDAGKTWQFKGLADAGLISNVVVSPNDPNTVWVAVLGNPWKPSATRGVFMTTDGGKNWKKVLY